MMSSLFKQLWICKWISLLPMGCSRLKSSSGLSETQLLTPIIDTPTNAYHTGKFVWADLLTPDAVRARTFYGELFGWTFEQHGRYTMVKNNGHRIAGIVEIQPESGKKGEALWLTAMSVPDIDKAVCLVRERGGAVLKGPVDMENRGRGALVSDPQGAQLVLLRAAGGDPVDSDPEIGDWLWNEIWTNEPHKTSSFYQSLGSYKLIVLGDDYEILVNDEKWRGGIRYIFKDEYQTRWVPVVRVLNPAEMLGKVKELGGVVLLRPDETPGNVDTALITDTSGALLMLQRWSPEQIEEAR